MNKNDRLMAGAGVIITIIALILAFVLGGGAGHPGGIPPPPPDRYGTGNMSLGQSGSSQENAEAAYEESLTSPIWINITLTWTDEPDSGVRFTNEPDQFGLRLEGPEGQSDETSLSINTPGGQGSVSLNFQVEHGEDNWTAGSGTWNIWVVCGDCGNQKPIISIFDLREQEDGGNSWEYTIDVIYFMTEEDGGGERR
jgi:hypothetical protein